MESGEFKKNRLRKDQVSRRVLRRMISDMENQKMSDIEQSLDEEFRTKAQGVH